MALPGYAARGEDGMKVSFGNMWIGLVLQQTCNYRLANAVMAKSLETCLPVGPQTLVDCRLPASEERLNPLEFHGKRRPVWPLRSQAGR